VYPASPMVRTPIALLLGFAGCSSSATGAAAATVISSLAATAVYRSATGYRCWAVCTNGTLCNDQTGMCEPIACGGFCRPGEHCDLEAHPPMCTREHDELKIGRDELISSPPAPTDALRPPSFVAPERPTVP
jgi:hypothetical protein